MRMPTAHPAAHARPARRELPSGAGRYLIAALFGAHGLVHLMGCAAAWQLGHVTGVSAVPTLLPGLAAGSPLLLLIGTLWLVATLAFLAAAVGLVLVAPWWRSVAGRAALLSLVLCAAWWSSAWFGAVLTIAILAGLSISSGIARPKGA